MGQLNFDEKTGNLLPQKIKYTVKHEEETEEMFDKYLQENSNFRIDYDKRGNAIFKKKSRQI